MDDYICRVCREGGDGNTHYNPEFDAMHTFEPGYDDDPGGSCGGAYAKHRRGEDCTVPGCGCTWFDTIGAGDPSEATVSETRNVSGIDGEGGWA